MRQRFEALVMLVKSKDMMEKQTNGRLRSYKLVMLKDTETNSYDFVRTLVLVFTLQKVYIGWLRR